MALRRLLKNSVQITQKQQQIRGAHGWPRPDVPVDFSMQYYHKRELSIYDLNCWYYDHTQPEYMFTWNEQHLNDHFGALQEIGRQAPLIWALMAGVGLFYYVFSNSRHASSSYHFVKDQHYQYILDHYNQRKATKRNWLGLDLTGENGTIYVDYDKKDNIRADIDKRMNDAAQTIKINNDGKNFILKVIEETTQEIKNKQK